MKKLDKLILKAFWSPFVITLTVVIFIFIMRLIIMYFSDLFGKNLGIGIYFELYGYCSLQVIPIALPLAALLSSLMTFGKLGEHFELTAIKSSGISMFRILRPIFIISILLTLATFWYSNVVMPWTNLRFYSLLYDIKTKKASLNIKPGIFYDELPGYSIKVSKKFPDNKSLKNVLIYDHNNNDGNSHVTIADSGQMYTIHNSQYLVFEMFNGFDYLEDPDKNNANNQTDLVVHRFKRSKVVMSLASFEMQKTDDDQYKHHQIMKNLTELSKDTDSLRRYIKNEDSMFVISTKSNYAFLFKQQQSKNKILVGKWIGDVMKKGDNTKSRINEYALNQATNLLASINSNYETKDERNENYYRTYLEWHHKFSSPIAVFVMFLIGAPLGAIIKKGGFGMPVIVGILFFILMYIMTNQGDKYAKEGRALVEIGAWTSNLVLLIIGLYFLYIATNDSRLFEPDMYKMKFEKIKTTFLNFINKRKKTINE
ncbi:MAG: LptF/LptG family permease [Pseudarcicella sp.]|nr:LptF/LptG family permease [Pseudarcicella sp.]MBP6410074.1 LptF/LptG family permease [Pseudarcicella sp.]